MTEDYKDFLDDEDVDHAAASERDLEENVQSEENARDRAELLDDLVAIHEDLEDLLEEAYETAQTDIHGVVRDVVRALRTSPFGAVKENQEEDEDDD